MSQDLQRPFGRIPPTIREEDRHSLVASRTRQNYNYQAKIYLLEVIRKHEEEIPAKYWVGAMNQTIAHLHQLDNQEKEELLKKEAIADDK